MVGTNTELSDFPHVNKKSPSLRVLVVDDEPLIRWSLSETLMDHGFDVLEAADAVGTVRALRDGARAVDVVLLDFRLPDSNDLTLLSAIRRLAPDAQVILMTAYGTPELVKTAIDLGAFRVVSKPFEMNELADLILQAHASRSS